MLSNIPHFEEVFRIGDTIGVLIYGISVSVMIIIGVYKTIKNNHSKK